MLFTSPYLLAHAFELARRVYQGAPADDVVTPS
jgi:hypothetical protein